jgi:LuxR family maltose regulon positive regulatory protein
MTQMGAALSLGGQRPLLLAKLQVPVTPAAAVARPRLLHLLDGAGQARLTVVVAPSGWGKSTLLSAWADAADRRGRTAWLSLDEADDEPIRFWTYALSALERVAPHLTRDALAVLQAPGVDSVDAALSLLLNELATAEGSCALVLDDYHLLSNPLIHQSVEFLLSYLPSSLRLVVASRMDPPLPLARMRARGELLEIRADDLSCTAEEAALLVAAVLDRGDLSPSAHAELLARTEGWPAGLHLAAYSLRRSEDPEAMAAELRGDDRHVLDYFGAEVLPGLTDQERTLLVRCSVLERLSGPLCDAVLKGYGSVTVLEDLGRAHLFISELGRGWYRCHRLFRDVLSRELAGEPNVHREELLGRAADWFLSEGLLEEALEHHLQAGDHQAALDLVLGSGRWFMEHGSYAVLQPYAARLAERVSNAGLFLTLAGSAGLQGDAIGCAAWLEAAEPLIRAGHGALPGWTSLRAASDAAKALLVLHGDTEAALLHARRAVELEVEPTAHGWIISRQALAGALLGAGQAQEAVGVLQDCWHSPARYELSALFLLQLAGQLALAYCEAGDLDGMRRLSAEVADAAAAAEAAWGSGAAAAVAGLRLGEARALLATDPAAAVPALERAVQLAEDWGRTVLTVIALASLAAAQWGQGDHPAARLSLARAREAVETGGARPATVQQLDLLEARIAQASTQRAVAEGGRYEPLTDRELSILRALRGPLSARDIGAEMYLSINTVKGYTKSLYRKLGVVTRADAVRRGRELGLI